MARRHRSGSGELSSALGVKKLMKKIFPFSIAATPLVVPIMGEAQSAETSIVTYRYKIARSPFGNIGAHTASLMRDGQNVIVGVGVRVGPRRCHGAIPRLGERNPSSSHGPGFPSGGAKERGRSPSDCVGTPEILNYTDARLYSSHA
jgi:hypothetical protein